jgi:mRNA interferase MazF
VTVAPVTTRIRQIPVEVPLGPDDGLPKNCVVNLDNIATISINSLLHPVALLRPEKIQQVDAAIHFALGLVD